MGWKKNKKNASGDSKKPQAAPKTDGFHDIVYENAGFTNYYQSQKIVEAHEWESFIDSLKKSLPATFRLVPTAGGCDKLKVFFDKVVEDGLVNLRKLDFFPDGLAYQFETIDRAELRKNKKANDTMQAIQQVLALETQRGGIQRQETVSLLPPLLMDLKASDRVLDTCSAPGSKTSEIADLMTKHQRDTNMSSSALLPSTSPLSSSTPSQGFVIANEVDVQRANILTHQLSRLPSPYISVSLLDGTTLSMLRQEGTNRSSPLNTLFNKVLTDVPCSGDGTMRKNVDVWRRWSPLDALQLHSTQLKIVQKAFSALEDGGRLVYSTCSLNPLENEAVVAAFLSQAKGEAILCDSALFSSFRVRQGLSEWKVPNPTDRSCQEWVESFEQGKELLKTALSAEAAETVAEQTEATVDTSEEAVDAVDVTEPTEENAVGDLETETAGETAADNQAEGVKAPVRRRRNPLHLVKETMFCDYASEEIKKELYKCSRILPHDNNTGGFFVAVFEKKASLPSSPLLSSPPQPAPKKLKREKEESIPLEMENDDKQPLNSHFNTSALRFGNIPSERFQSLDEFFGFSLPSRSGDIATYLGEKKPVLSSDSLLVRDYGCKRIYLSTSPFSQWNQKLYQQKNDVRWISVGTKVIQKFSTRSAQDNLFRLTQEGVKCLVPFMSRRLLFVSPLLAKKLLDTPFVDLQNAEEWAMVKENSVGLDQFFPQGEWDLSAVQKGAVAVVTVPSLQFTTHPFMTGLKGETQEEEVKEEAVGEWKAPVDKANELVFAAFMTPNKLELLVSKQDRLAYLLHF